MICDGWSITTVEGLGGKAVGYHPIQTALAATGGTQCGYCSPGMVMQLHSYLQEHPDATVKDIDNILDGNICRCTGYRPILDAFKEFGSDAPKKFSHLIADIEDLSLKGICKRTGEACPETVEAQALLDVTGKTQKMPEVPNGTNQHLWKN